MKTYKGSCHCGQVKFEVTAQLDSAVICNCSICRKKGVLLHKVPKTNFKILQGEDMLSLYQFNTKRARHYFCKNCGIHPFGFSRSDPENSVMINVNCLDDEINKNSIKIRKFDGKNWEDAVKNIAQNKTAKKPFALVATSIFIMFWGLIYTLNLIPFFSMLMRGRIWRYNILPVFLAFSTGIIGIFIILLGRNIFLLKERDRRIFVSLIKILSAIAAVPIIINFIIYIFNWVFETHLRSVFFTYFELFVIYIIFILIFVIFPSLATGYYLTRPKTKQLFTS